MVDQSVMISFEDSINDGFLSFINGSNVGDSEESKILNDKPMDLNFSQFNIA